MSEFKRQHPVAAISRLLAVIRENLITLLIVIFIGSSRSFGEIFWYIIGFTIIFALFAGVLSWWKFRYRIVDDELQIRKGIIVRSNLYLSKDKIQVIDISQGIVQRLFDLVSVEIKSAGGGTETATISAVSKEEAEYLRKELRSEKTELRDKGEDAEETNGTIAVQPDWKLSNKDLVLAALTSGNFGLIASILGAISGQLDEFINEENLNYLYSLIPGYSDFTVIVGLIVAIFIISWTLSFLGVIFKYANFTIHKKDKELLISSGLLERKHVTVPYDRIQGVRFVEGIFRQPFGFGMMYVESAGFAQNNKERSIVMAPIIRTNNAREFLESFLDEVKHPEWEMRPPKKSLYRYIRKPDYLVLLVAPLLWLMMGTSSLWILIPALPLSSYFGYIRYKDAAIGMEDEVIKLRHRVLARTTMYIHRKRIQTLELHANPFQKRKKLQTFQLTVASGSGGQQASIEDLDESQVQALILWSLDKHKTNQDQAAKKEKSA